MSELLRRLMFCFFVKIGSVLKKDLFLKKEGWLERVVLCFNCWLIIFFMERYVESGLYLNVEILMRDVR